MRTHKGTGALLRGKRCGKLESHFKKNPTLKMASRKCCVCNTRSSSHWFGVTNELNADVEKCFRVEISCEEVYLCASCWRNLTRWRQDGFQCEPEKYFGKANSRENPTKIKRLLPVKIVKLRYATKERTVGIPVHSFHCQWICFWKRLPFSVSWIF